MNWTAHPGVVQLRDGRSNGISHFWDVQDLDMRSIPQNALPEARQRHEYTTKLASNCTADQIANVAWQVLQREHHRCHRATCLRRHGYNHKEMFGKDTTAHLWMAVQQMLKALHQASQDNPSVCVK